MRYIFVFTLFFLVSSNVSAQNLRKKYFGTYSGAVAPYALDAGGEVLTVKGSTISFSIEEGSAVETINEIAVSGKWQLIATKSDYYEIGFTAENSVVLQKYYLFKKGKKMERDGIYPQPDCTLVKN